VAKTSRSSAGGLTATDDRLWRIGRLSVPRGLFGYTTEAIRLYQLMTDDTTIPTDAEDRSDALVHAVGLYALGKVNEGKAAEIADMTRWEMRDILADGGLELQHAPQTVEQVREDAGLTPGDTEDSPEDQQQAIEACQHAADALSTGDLSRGRSLLNEAVRAVERAQHDDTPTQEQRETAFDCYD
jgi:predicted HTH domain antitoxin